MRLLFKFSVLFSWLLFAGNNLSAQKTDPLNCDSFYVPNVFLSENCETGNCDFLPKFICGAPEQFEMQIFDRWGNLIFKSSDAHIGWSGRNQKTKAVCGEGVYFYILKFSFTKSEKMKEYTGHISLIR